MKKQLKLAPFSNGSIVPFKLKGEPPMTRFVAAQLAKAHYFDNSAAKADFGYAPEINNEEGLKRTLAWLKESGRI